ncbi:hypothetical protein II582_00450 [bacterium]|nr:hypothetical protein [bacterium]
MKNPVINKIHTTINIKGSIKALILLKRSHKMIRTIHAILQTFSVVSDFFHRPQISPATSLLFSPTFPAVSFRESFASHIFFSKSVFFSFFSGILNNIML